MPKWFAHELEALRKLEGKSASEMVREMRKLRPEVTRNGIVGVCHRHGIKMSPGQSAAQRTENGRKAHVRLKAQGLSEIRTRKGSACTSALKPLAAPYLGRPDAWKPIDGSVPIGLIERKPMQCAWPIGEPARPADQIYCGAACVDDTLPYCAAHRRLRLARYVPSFLADVEQIAA
jgi:hypothetical protein